MQQKIAELSEWVMVKQDLSDMLVQPWKYCKGAGNPGEACRKALKSTFSHLFICFCSMLLWCNFWGGCSSDILKYAAVFLKFSWRIIVLRYCVGFCHTSTWINHRYTYVKTIPPSTKLYHNIIIQKQINKVDFRAFAHASPGVPAPPPCPCNIFNAALAYHWYFWLWWWRRHLRVPWTARRSNQSILKEISPQCSLEGLMLKLKLQYFGHLMWRTDSLEKTLMLG